MIALDILVIVLFGVNVFIPFVLKDSANKWCNGIGWGFAIMWFCIAKFGS